MHLGHFNGAAARVQTTTSEGRLRSRTTSRREIARELRRGGADNASADELEELERLRPKTRAQCEGGMRPCPFLGCRYHLAAEVSHAGGLKLNHLGRDLAELDDTCALDVADRGGITLEEVAIRLNVTRERVRQIEAKALGRLATGVRR